MFTFERDGGIHLSKVFSGSQDFNTGHPLHAMVSATMFYDVCWNFEIKLKNGNQEIQVNRE